MFNCYRRWAHLLLSHPSNAPFILLIWEGVTQGDSLSIVLYGITLVLLTEDLKDADTTLLSTLYANDAVFDGSLRQSTTQLKILMDRGKDRGYFPNPAKSVFIADNPEDKEAAKRGFYWAGLNLSYVDGEHYLEAYLGTKEELDKWVRTL